MSIVLDVKRLQGEGQSLAATRTYIDTEYVKIGPGTNTPLPPGMEEDARAATPAGVPDGVSPDELERWPNELVAFLTSDGIPASFRGWARKHADLLDAYMVPAEDFESDLSAGESDLDVDEEEQDEAPASAPRALSALPLQKSPRATTAGPADGQHAGAADGRAARAGAARQARHGHAVGVLALFAIFGVRSLTSGDGNGGSLPATAGAAAFNQARADELQALL